MIILGDYYDFLLFSALERWGLDCAISALLAFSFIHFANGIYFFGDVMVDVDSLLRLEEFFL